MVNITDGATDSIVEQSVEQLVIKIRSNDTSSTDSEEIFSTKWEDNDNLFRSISPMTLKECN